MAGVGGAPARGNALQPLWTGEGGESGSGVKASGLRIEGGGAPASGCDAA